MLSSDPSVLQIAYLPNGGFVLPILGRLQQSASPKVRAVAQKWVDSELADLACSLSTKVSMLSLLSERIYGSVTPLFIDIASDPNSRAAFEERKTWVPGNRRQPYQVLVDVDTFVFEFRSTYEILGKFLGLFFEIVLGRAVKEQTIKTELQARGVDMNWANELQEHRKIFFHNQAPWLAVRIKNWDTFEAELLILADSGSDAGNPDEAFPFSRLAAIYAGMARSLRHLQDWVLVEIQRLESESPPQSA